MSSEKMREIITLLENTAHPPFLMVDVKGHTVKAHKVDPQPKAPAGWYYMDPVHKTWVYPAVGSQDAKIFDQLWAAKTMREADGNLPEARVVDPVKDQAKALLRKVKEIRDVLRRNDIPCPYGGKIKNGGFRITLCEGLSDVYQVEEHMEILKATKTKAESLLTGFSNVEVKIVKSRDLRGAEQIVAIARVFPD